MACDSAHRVLWNRWSLHVLGVVGPFHSFWPIVHLLVSKEDEDSCACLLRSVTEHCFSLTGETPDLKFTIFDDSDATLNAFKKLFLSALHLYCCYHAMGKNLEKLGPLSREAMGVDNSIKGVKNTQSNNVNKHFDVAIGKVLAKHEHEPLLLEKLVNCSGCPKGNWASAKNTSGIVRSNNETSRAREQ